MLPNLKILICGAVFALLLFVVTGAGVMLPESYTRVGEIPQVSRPMMQRMITDDPAQAQFQVLTLARRNEELDRLRERAALEVVPAAAAASPDSEPLKPTIIDDLATDVMQATGTSDLQSSEATGTVSATTSGSVPAGSPELKPDGTPQAALATDEDPVRIAALPPPPADVEPGQPWPSQMNIPLPRIRPTGRMRGVHRRAALPKPRVVTAASDIFGQNLFGPSQLPSR
jgi:hypothetical protein